MTDMLLGQKTILISVMFALVPLLAAVMLVVIARIRQGAAQRRLKRARMAKRRLAQLEAARAEQAAASQSVAAAPANAKQADVAAAPVAPAATKATPSAPVAKYTAGGEQKPPEEQPASSTEQNKPANSAMQDILSSVFGDEEAAAQSEALLKGLDEVNISELAVLCREVAVKVHPDGTSVAENKE
jgi:hypothetical protein